MRLIMKLKERDVRNSYFSATRLNQKPETVKFQRCLLPVQRILLELYIFKVSELLEHVVIDDFYLIVIKIEIFQIGKQRKYDVVDYSDVIERQIQRF